MKILAGIFIALASLVLFTSPALAQLGISPGTLDMVVGEGHNPLPSTLSATRETHPRRAGAAGPT